MPDMDGLEASHAIRQIETAEHEPVIVAVTADAMKGAEERCIAAGMDDYISKPVDKDKLRTLLKTWLPDNMGKNKENNAAETISNAAIPTAEIIDWSKLNDFTGGEKEMEQEILTIFIDNLKADIITLEKNYKNNDHEQWDETAHKLYGASAHIGAIPLAHICDKAQTLYPEQTNQIPSTHTAIINEYQRVDKLLKEKMNTT